MKKLRLALIALLLASFALLSWPQQQAQAAASTQTTHAFLCRPIPSGAAAGPGKVVNTSSTASPQPSYILNADGCALIAAADIGYFLSQGFYYGPSTFVLQQQAITASTTASTSTITLPAYGYILAIVLEETAGNAITGGVDIGDATSATTYVSARALGANATVSLTDALTLARINAPSGVPTADQILVACHTACNSGSINITILYTYY
jgi:hypothetical protein